MSDTEEEGTFDKEAEKEKLREQLAREEEDRRSTQHMSELLLKGATMTNKHCDTCGDPLFRHEGQEFCPTCAQEGAAGAAQPAAEEAAAGGSGEGAGRQPGESGDDAARGSTGVDRVDVGRPAEKPASGTADAGGATAPTASGRASPPRRAEGDVGEDVAAARASLARKLSALARQAEATDDVGRSRELLGAAREAAEALAAIDRLRG